jgi:hypothetical protein
MTSNVEWLLFVLGAAIAGVFLVLLLFGEIGPQWWKTLMHRYQRWNFGDASPILPIDPYKPISEALSESPDKFPPVKERLKNSFSQLALFWAIGIALGILLIALASALKW